MGNCLPLPSSLSPYPSSCSYSSSTFSFSSSAATSLPTSKASSPSRSAVSKPRSSKILPFPTLSNLSAHYELGRELGRGQFGVIRLCTSRATGTQFACKSLSKLRIDDRQLVDILREVRIMQRLSRAPSAAIANNINADNINIVGLRSVVEDATHVHLIMELCAGGELFDRIVKKKHYSEAQAASIMKSLMTSVQFCHRMGIMHRDLKPENILLVKDCDSSDIKLADFGLALEFSSGQKFSGMAGSAYYIAPEILNGEYSEEVDIWSAGVVLYVLLSGMPPFWGETEHEIFKAIREGNLEFKWDPWNSISQSAKDLIKQMLCPDVKTRLTPLQVLEHQWILRHTKQASQEHHCHRSIVGRPRKACQQNNTDAPPLNLPDLHCVDILKKPETIHDAVASRQRIPSFSSPKSCYSDSKEQNTIRQITTVTKASDDRSPPEALCPNKALNIDLSTLFTTLEAELKLPMPNNLTLSGVTQRDGWSCTCVSVGATEQIFAVGYGKQKYIVAYCGGKTGWTLLGRHHCKVLSQVPMPELPVCF